MSEEGHNNAVADWVEFFAESAVDPSPITGCSEMGSPQHSYQIQHDSTHGSTWMLPVLLTKDGQGPEPQVHVLSLHI